MRIPLVCARVVSLREGKGSEEERPVNWEQESSLRAPDVVPKEEEYTCMSSGFVIGSGF